MMTEPFRIATLFDSVDPVTGPRFAHDHPREQDPDEIRRLCEYLDGGAPLLVATSLGEDLYDPSRGPQVPIAAITDGHWIWSGGHSYYLEEYGLALEPEFAEHIRAREYRVPEPEDATVSAALACLREHQARQQNG